MATFEKKYYVSFRECINWVVLSEDKRHLIKEKLFHSIFHLKSSYVE